MKTKAKTFEQWLRSMPRVNRLAQITMPVRLTLTAEQFVSLAKGAAHRGQTIDEALSDLLADGPAADELADLENAG